MCIIRWSRIHCVFQQYTRFVPGIPHLRFPRKSTASSTAICIQPLDCNWNSQASSQYISILQMSLTVAVLSIAYNVLNVYGVASMLPPCSSLLFPRLLRQLWWFLKLYVIEMARACREYCRTLESLLFTYCFRDNRITQDSWTRLFDHSNPSHQRDYELEAMEPLMKLKFVMGKKVAKHESRFTTLSRTMESRRAT